jgi:hypothetical protein
MTREKAAMWGGVLFGLSIVVTGIVLRKSPRLWIGLPLFTALFACSAVVGLQASREKIRASLGEGLRAVAESAPLWGLGALVVIVLIGRFAGWSWFWRSSFPLAAGLLTGLLWPRPEKPPEEAPKTEQEGPPPMDFWKP